MSRSRTFPFRVAGVLLVAACVASPFLPPEAVQLAFTVQPGDAAAGDAIGPVVTVTLQDGSGQTVTSADNMVTVALKANPGSGTLSGTVSVAAVQGVATFSDLHVDKAAAGYTLTAAATGLSGATSTQFAITAGPAAQLVFLVQPANTMEGIAITPPVQVAALDAFTNLATAFEDSVTVALGGTPAPGNLSGTTTVKAVGGIAAFGDLTIVQTSLGYNITSSAAGLTGATSTPFDITPSPPVPLIVFQSKRGIEAINPDGSGRTVLIADTTVSQPAWSPNGAMLAFTRTSADFRCDIYVARVDGSGAQKITNTVPSFPCARSPSWSPDGKKIAFAMDGGAIPPGGRIYVTNADGSNATQIFADSNGWPGHPTWSPDGTKLAFDDLEAACGEICEFLLVGGADGSNTSYFTSGGCESSPAWSPDGTEVAFVGACKDAYTADTLGIWVANVDGSGARNLTDVACLCDVDPAWSPDGAQLVFSRATGGNPPDLYIMNRDGTGLRQLTATPDISERLPAWRTGGANGSAGRARSGFVTSTAAARSPR